MATAYKEKTQTKTKVTVKPAKGRPNWDQSITRTADGQTVPKTPVYIPQNTNYTLLLKKYNFVIEYTNLELLRAFLSTYGQILPRIQTRISLQQQVQMGKALRRARAERLIPFTYL